MVPWPGTIFPSFFERNICQISQLCQTTRAARMTYSSEVMTNCGSDGKRTAHTLKHTLHPTRPTRLALKPTRSALRSQWGLPNRCTRSTYNNMIYVFCPHTSNTPYNLFKVMKFLIWGMLTDGLDIKSSR